LKDPEFISIKNDYLKTSVISQLQIEKFKEITLSTLSKGKLKNYNVQRFIDNNEDVEKVFKFLCSNNKLQKKQYATISLGR